MVHGLIFFETVRGPLKLFVDLRIQSVPKCFNYLTLQHIYEFNMLTFTHALKLSTYLHCKSKFLLENVCFDYRRASNYKVIQL